MKVKNFRVFQIIHLEIFKLLSGFHPIDSNSSDYFWERSYLEVDFLWDSKKCHPYNIKYGLINVFEEIIFGDNTFEL